MRYDPTRFARFCERHRITRAHLLLIGLFWLGHPEQSWVQAALAFVRREGPAAVAAGRAGGVVDGPQ